MQDEIRKVQDTSRLLISLATFNLTGHRFRHRVLVLPLVGQPIDPMQLGKIPMASRISAARQLLEVLETLDEAGIVHGGE